MLTAPRKQEVTHVLQGDDVGMLSVSQQDLHLLGRVFLGLTDDLGGEFTADASTTLLNVWMSGLYLDGVLHARSFV